MWCDPETDHHTTAVEHKAKYKQQTVNIKRDPNYTSRHVIVHLPEKLCLRGNLVMAAGHDINNEMNDDMK
jgi:hypothetical protein